MAEAPTTTDVAVPVADEPQAHWWNGWVHWGAFVIAAAAVVAIVVQLWGHYRGTAADRFTPYDPDLAPVLIGLVVLFLAGSVFALRPELGQTHRMVLTATVWSLTFLGALIVAWTIVNGSALQRLWSGTPVLDVAERDAYLERAMPGWTPTSPKPLLIPTGVMVQSVEFLNANNVQVTGYVWQKYGPDVPDDFEQGVVFPESVKEAYSQEEVYRYQEGDTEVVGWYFAATLRQRFDYGQYPYDRQNVWLRMWSRDFGRGALLVPDYDSYFTLEPSQLPGIENQFVYGGWTPIYSGFSYAQNTYDSSFGLPKAEQSGSFPELYFNFVLKRNFLGPFTDFFIFGIAASLLLFAILALTTNNEELKKRFGLSTAGVLGSVSGLFFAVILKHNQIRTNLGTPATTYSEAVPYILYVLLVLVALNAVLLASPYDIPFIEYKQNLLPKLLYWPVLLGLLLAITLVMFLV